MHGTRLSIVSQEEFFSVLPENRTFATRHFLRVCLYYPPLVSRQNFEGAYRTLSMTATVESCLN